MIRSFADCKLCSNHNHRFAAANKLTSSCMYNLHLVSADLTQIHFIKLSHGFFTSHNSNLINSLVFQASVLNLILMLNYLKTLS